MKHSVLLTPPVQKHLFNFHEHNYLLVPPLAQLEPQHEEQVNFWTREAAGLHLKFTFALSRIMTRFPSNFSFHLSFRNFTSPRMIKMLAKFFEISMPSLALHQTHNSPSFHLCCELTMTKR